MSIALATSSMPLRLEFGDGQKKCLAKKMNTQEISINEIRQSLHKHLVGPDFSAEQALRLYCFIKKKWGFVKYDENGHNPMAVIQDRHES